MSTTLTVAEAQSRFKELVEKLTPGEEILVTENEQPIARIVGVEPARTSRPAPGLGKGSILYMAPDFDDPMEEFKEYTE